MVTFSYIVVDSKGKEKRGSMETKDRATAAAILRAQGCTLVELREASVLDQDVHISFLEKKPKPRELAIFCRQFLSILNAGVPMVKALSMLTLQTNNKILREAIDDCRQEIEKGTSLADAMKRHRNIFSDFFITLVAAGEASGSLEVSLERMGTQLEKEAKVRDSIQKTATYPIIVCVVAVVVVAIMLTYVVPQFETLLSDLGSKLPAVTVFVMNASDFLVQKWYIILGILIFLVVFVLRFRKTNPGMHFFGKIAMKTPVIGDLTTKTASARMARTLATLMAAGIPLIEALEIVSNTLTNIHFKEALIQAKDEVAMGAPLSECIERSGIFPALVYQMIGVGEETGEIDKMMTKLAEYYEDEVETSTTKMMTLLEPMIIILLALVVGVIVLSVLLPMAEMYKALENL